MSVFNSRVWSIREFKATNERGELDLTPEFQRRDVWSDKARSYLIDTIARGKPIPKIFLRQIDNAETTRTIYQVIDGQQRLNSVFLFLADGFRINKIHNAEAGVGGKYFSQLSAARQKDILHYEFSCDILYDIPDPEVWDIFARLNKYPVKINAQELRNSQFYGEFKSTIYSAARKFNAFWINNGIFTSKQMSRMLEAEFVSDLFLTMSVGTKAFEKRVLDKAYQDWDESFPNHTVLVRRFTQIMDLLGEILDGLPADTKFRGVPLFYTLFCSTYHMQFGLPKLKLHRTRITQAGIPKVQVALGRVDEIFEVESGMVSTLPDADQNFRRATEFHTPHASNREIRAHYLISLLNAALRP